MRWENLTTDADDRERLPGYSAGAVVRTFDAPEALETRFYEVRSKSALNRVPEKSRMPFRWTINPYRGCSHACRYCFARPTHQFLGFDADRDFVKEIVVKVNVPEVLRAELARPSWKGEHVALGTNTDPYQWVEGRYKLMRGVWEAMRDFRNPCSILTKSPLVLRDLDLLSEIAAVAPVHAHMSIPTIDPEAWRATEPGTPNPLARLRAVKELNDAGIPCGVLVAPLMPGINDSPDHVRCVLEAAAEAGATDVGGRALYLQDEVRNVFFAFLADWDPALLERYEALYARGAYLPRAESTRLHGLLEHPDGLGPPTVRFGRGFGDHLDGDHSGTPSTAVRTTGRPPPRELPLTLF